MVDDVVELYVKATCKRRGPDAREAREHEAGRTAAKSSTWRARAEETQRFRVKEEAWEFFRRQGSPWLQTTGEFEQEVKRNVANGLGRSSQEKESRLRIWTEELQKKAQQEDAGWKPGEEEIWARRLLFPKAPGMGENMGTANPVPTANLWSKQLTCDVELDVKVSASGRLLPVGLLSGDNPPCPEQRRCGSHQSFDLSRCQPMLRISRSNWVLTNSPLSRTKSLHYAHRSQDCNQSSVLPRLATRVYNGKY